MPRPTRSLAARAEEVYRILAPLWPDAQPLLHYRDCFELLCAVLLSAQCTDEQVNKATPDLFAAWPGPQALAAADPAEVEAAIHSLGFFRTKARHLIGSSRILVERFGGRVPDSMEELLSLPGVGRKTANLVLSSCFGQPGIIVDTHVLRVSLRLGFHDRPDPAAVESRIAELVPPERRTRFSHALNRHGKWVCSARKPACLGSELPPCPLAGLCPRIGLANPRGS
ncbi:MAG TPA: endonuclease III [Spirochaetales bacterium]|nr:endonuclease III [Spirochaetales bacterium]HRY55552.1 endonuclease III [Spirochaetia bacterium]HRZ64788.1 endonuclease III [Spirochaetia bacterium]